ncbi:MAG: DUF1015 domain-containing protein [Actinobacteria bacterium]|nr:DUF1015 domain-containing protein [Actinomycetota bacterium]
MLPSGQPPPSGHQRQPGLALTPFRGLRYAPDRVSGLAEVTSPPYDVIAHDTEGQLLAADPHNVVRLILPRPDARHAGGEYREAARLLQGWQADGILLPDAGPALYVYEQRERPGGDSPGAPWAGGTAAGPAAAGRVIQRGLIGALRLAPAGNPAVLPHENVLPGPVAGRRELMEATGANLEPIFLLYDGGGAGAASRLPDEVAERDEPLLTVDTGDGIRHRLWAVTDPARHAAVAADLAGRQALIADGNHRYAAYLEIQSRQRAAGAGPGPWDSGLALLVDSDAYPPRLGAIHRMVAGLPPADAAARAKGAFTVRAVPGLSSPELAAAGPAGTAALGAAAAALTEASREGPAFLLAGGGDVHLLTDPDPDQVAAAMPGRSAGWRELPTAVLQELLLARLWGIRDDDPSVQIHHDLATAVRAAGEPPGGTAVICPPLSADRVREIAAAGERLPRKSTSFGPKPRTGLVMRTFELG